MRYSIRTVMLGILLGGIALTTGSAQQPDEKKVKLEVGDAAPAFEAADDTGKPWKSTEQIGKKLIVVYFYPGDFTPGCTAQAKSFQENMNKIRAQGAEVVGVSGDSVTTHALFKQVHKLNFPLLADEDGSLAGKFGVPVGPGGQVRAKDADGAPLTLKRAGTASRWTFVIGMDGKIIYKNTKVNPIDDSKQVAAVIEKVKK